MKIINPLVCFILGVLFSGALVADETPKAVGQLSMSSHSYDLTYCLGAWSLKSSDDIYDILLKRGVNAADIEHINWHKGTTVLILRARANVHSELYKMMGESKTAQSHFKAISKILAAGTLDQQEIQIDDALLWLTPTASLASHLMVLRSELSTAIKGSQKELALRDKIAKAEKAYKESLSSYLIYVKKNSEIMETYLK